ncbi:MAG: DUF6320 domain-containing protein [Oscillospiraceae bacterium]|jgi:hypothetical protein|nr:DUF6320 domain-containing protein [Oscillospiraceae bacterium]
MSYCVNCGVELDKSAKKCALCATPVVNPNEKNEEHPQAPPYSSTLVIPKGVSRKYVAFIISMVILIPNIVCVIVNLLLPHTGSWSVYVVASSALVWFLFVFPSLMSRSHPYILLSVDTVTSLLYIYIFYALNKQEGWFSRVAVPLVALFSLICLFMVKWLAKERDGVHIAMVVLAEIALFSVFTDAVVNYFYVTGRLIFVSIPVSVSCFALIGFFVFVAKNKRFRAWLSQKFFV